MKNAKGRKKNRGKKLDSIELLALPLRPSLSLFTKPFLSFSLSDSGSGLRDSLL